MTWFLQMLWLTSWLSTGGALGAIVLALLRRWTLVRAVARVVTLASGGIILLVVGLFVFGIMASNVAASLFHLLIPDADPGERARMLAEGISEMINCSAMSVPAVVIGATVWLVSRKRIPTASL